MTSELLYSLLYSSKPPFECLNTVYFIPNFLCLILFSRECRLWSKTDLQGCQEMQSLSVELYKLSKLPK